ncbi:hypothetical protein VC83_05250 [Pseudogymnoascus destructans]|nr:uncharacterized protein VC83_05250 [Pseudogymnoascus destructans]OAF58106.1 hypothetical protein VC83_05250 [Pseudogymnoascus destructans]
MPRNAEQIRDEDMTTLRPRAPYSDEELAKLYPSSLKLQQVQVLLRHGERSPVSARFQNAGLAPFWPYCSVAQQLLNATLNSKSSQWGTLEWKRRLETFGPKDNPVIASGPEGEVDAICNLGELTDTGRRTTLALGKRLRHLYVDQLNFMPSTISNGDMIYLRATPIPRALESMQEAFWGLYPSDTRSASFPPPTIITRNPSDETLFPNDGNCRRFAMLSRAFAQRTADRWNDTTEMAYLTKKIGKWMPDPSKGVAVDSRPRLSGIMDTINSTLAHGPETRLPNEFYDDKGREIIEKIGVEEWFSGYKESQEYRALGIGGLMGDICQRMVGHVERNGNSDGASNGPITKATDGEQDIKLGLSGCHDTTLAAILTSLGAFDGEKWPPYTSHVALELFKREDQPVRQVSSKDQLAPNTVQSVLPKSEKQSWFGWFSKGAANQNIAPTGISRKRIEELNDTEKEKLDGYYVRIRYNDKPMYIPGCALLGNHLDGDESFCTLATFKAIVDKFTPKDWKQDCRSNLDAPSFPKATEAAGF